MNQAKANIYEERKKQTLKPKRKEKSKERNKQIIK